MKSEKSVSPSVILFWFAMPSSKKAKDLRSSPSLSTVTGGTYVKREKPLELKSKLHTHLRTFGYPTRRLTIKFKM